MMRAVTRALWLAFVAVAILHLAVEATIDVQHMLREGPPW